VEPGKVYTMGELFNEWSHVIDSAKVDVYRDNVFCHSHKIQTMMPGKKTWIPCGVEPSVGVELTTNTERGSKPVSGSTSQVSFLNVQHTAKVTTTSSEEASPTCIRVKLQLPKSSYNQGTKPSILPLGEYKYEQSEDFVDPPKAPTVHLVKEAGAAIIRIATGEAASFSYRIEWQDNLVTTTVGFGGGGGGAPAFGFQAAAPVGGVLQFGGAPAFGGRPVGDYEAEISKPASMPLPDKFNDSSNASAAAPPSFEEARAGQFGYKAPQQAAQDAAGENQQEDTNTDGSWVEAGSLPTQKQYASSSMPQSKRT
jgi:hypothetical protein